MKPPFSPAYRFIPNALILFFEDMIPHDNLCHLCPLILFREGDQCLNQKKSMSPRSAVTAADLDACTVTKRAP
jgi:hypothetical protein